MPFAHPLDVHDAIPRHTQSIPRDTTIPLPPRRALLQVTVPRESEDKSRAQLRALFNSPVSAYLTGTKVVRDMVNVHFDIAPEDLDSTMNTLIVTLPQAMIGPGRATPRHNKRALIMYSGIWLYDVQHQTGVNQGAHEGSLRQARNLFASLLPDCADT